MRKIELPIKEIVEKYENGTNPTDLAIEYGTSYSTIYNRLNKYYKNSGNERPVFKVVKKIELPIKEIIQKYENGTSIKDLAIEYEISKTTINIRIKEYYENSGKERPFFNMEKKKKELPIEEIVEKYENGTSIKDLVIEYGTSISFINKRLNEYYKNSGKERPFFKGGKKKKELPIEEIVEKYENGTNPTDLAIEYRTSFVTIYNRLDEYYKNSGKERTVVNAGRKKKELPIEEIIQKYKNGTSTRDLAIEYEISKATINRRIKEYYEKSGNERPFFRGGKKKKELQIKEIVEKYENGTSTRDLAIEYEISKDTINRRIKEYYEKSGNERTVVNVGKKIELPIKEIVEKYENGTSTRDLGVEYGTSSFTINNRLSEYYKNSGKERPVLKARKKELPIKEIVEKYENGTSTRDIAIEYRISHSTINNRLNEYYKNSGIERTVLNARKKELQIKEIVEKYENGTSTRALGIEYGITYDTMNNRLNAYYRNSGKERPFFRGGKKKKELPIKEIVEKYENGTSITDLVIEYGTSISFINRRLNEYYENSGKERHVLKRGKKKRELPIKEIVEKYENGTSITDLGVEYGTSSFIINNRLNEYYENSGKERPVFKRGRKKKELIIEEIVEKYENGISTTDLAIEYGIARVTIDRRLNEYYENSGKERPVVDVGKKIELPIEEIVEKYENGTNTTDLAIEYEISRDTINNRLNEYYKKSGKKVPRILKSKTVIEEYLKKGMSIEEIVEIASNRNIIIPKALIDKVLNNKNIADEER